MNSTNPYLVSGLLISLLCHGVLWQSLLRVPGLPGEKQVAPSRCLVAVRITPAPQPQRKLEKVPPPAEKKPAMKPRPVVERKQKTPTKSQLTQAQPAQNNRTKEDFPQPLPNSENQSRESAEPAQAKPVFGMNAATVAAGNGGGMTLSIGNTLQGEQAGTLSTDIRNISHRIVPTFELTSLPEYSQRVEPAYPKILEESEIQGKVLLLVTIDPDGKVRDVAVKQSDHPLFSDAAVAAMKQCIFKPAIQDGMAVASRIEIPVRFVLES